jgi:hypothetical protein
MALQLSLTFDSGALGKTGSYSVTTNGTLTFPTSGGVQDSGYGSSWDLSNYLQVTELSEASSGRGHTFIAWYKGTQTTISSLGYSTGVMIFGDTRGSVYMGLGTDDGKIAVGASGTQVRGTTNVATDEWVMLAWVYKSNDLIDGYVNGVKEITDANVSSSTVYNRVDTIGSYVSSYSASSPTALDEIRIYDEELTAQQILDIYQQAVPPAPNTLAEKFFPDVYFDLISDYTGTKKYIDSANGSDLNDGSSVANAYQTIDHALNENTTATPTMFVFLEGTYTITSVATGNSVGLRDGGNERVFVCCPGRTVIQWVADAAGRDAPMVQITNANSAIYGGIIRRNNNGRTTNYTVAYWKGPTLGNYYNCVFSETNANNAWSYQYDNSGTNNLAIRNCTFFNGANPSGNYTNAGTCLTIDSVFNTAVTTGGTETNVFKSQTVDPTTYETIGVTTAGVYSGTYSWDATITVPLADPGLYAPESVTRGNSFNVTLVTENVADNTTIAYTITGVTSGDLDGDPLTGNFTIVGNTDTVTVQTADIPLLRTLTFSANSLSVDVLLNGGKPVNAEILVVAGGGSGGNHNTTNANGGGGAGGLLHATGITIANGTYNIVVGAGASRVPNATISIGNKGGNSSFREYIAQGGGGGGSTGVAFDTDKMNGGSAGGVSNAYPGTTSSTQTDINSALGYGNAGGSSAVNYTGAGGGGAGSAGVNGSTTAPGGDGGQGLSFDISGETKWYAGGGGGGANSSERAGDGYHGGGRGFGTTSYYAYNSYPADQVNATTLGSSTPDAVANTGGGGGAGSYWGVNGGWSIGSGQGGSGVVVIKYSGAQIATGGTITTIDGDTIHTFTTSGSIEFDSPPYSPGLNANSTSVFNADTIEIAYVDQTAADNTNVAYTISGVLTSDINGASLTGNFTIVGGIAYLTLTATNVVNKTLTITAGGDSLNVTMQYAVSLRYLAAAGGGGGGMDMGGGGGAGGLLKSSSERFVSGNYSIVVGAGGAGAPAAGTGEGTQGRTTHQFTIPATKGQDTIFGNKTAVGGGIGGSSYYPYTPGASGGPGGSGGGSSGYSDGSIRAGGAGTFGQGNRGGQGGGQYYSGGGGGAGGQGVDSPARSDGGPGLEDDILGTAYYWAGGGGGSGYSIQGGNGGIGGGGGGAVGTTTGGAGLNNGEAGGGGSTASQTNKPGGSGGANTGGGGGGGSHYTATNQGGNGGSGIVVVRYSGGQKAVGGNVTTVSTDTVHTFTSSGTLTIFPGEGLTSSSNLVYFGDTFNIYLTANEADSTTVPYTISGVTSAEINGASLTGNFTITGGLASLEVVTVAGTLDVKTFSITAYGYTITVTVTYAESFILADSRTSSGWGIDQVFTVVTRNLPDNTNVGYTITGVTTEDLNNDPLTGDITITGNQGTLTVSSDPLLLSTKTMTVTLDGNISYSVLLTFVTVPFYSNLEPIAVSGSSVVPTLVTDLEESQIVAQQWTATLVVNDPETVNINGIKTIPTDPGDLQEQVTVSVTTGSVERVGDPKQVSMVGLSASPTYVYSDGAPVAAPDPSQLEPTQIWYIT